MHLHISTMVLSTIPRVMKTASLMQIPIAMHHKPALSSSSHPLNAPLRCQPASTDSNLLNGGGDAAELYRLSASELIHGGLGDVETTGGGVDCENVDRL
jgi:hypothetical protein